MADGNGVAGGAGTEWAGDVVLIGDPRVARMPLRECAEPLVDCREVLRVDRRRADQRGDWARLRAGVVERLLRAQELLPRGWRWLLVEGHRPPPVQRSIFNGYVARLRALRPEADETEILLAATRWCAPMETAGHVAGAAADLTVCTEGGIEIDMGSPEAATPEESDGACYTRAPSLGRQARLNRTAMIAALGAVGMANYPTEWWHWSYGDRYWAWSSGAHEAMYGPRAGVGGTGRG